MKELLLGMGLAVVIGAVFYFGFYSKLNITNQTMNQNPEEQTTKPASVDLQIEDIRVGTEVEAKTGNTVVVNYLGTLTDGTKFDSSYDRNQPFSFTLGQNQVIQGWEKGIVGMKVGGKRKLTVPSFLGYGNQEVGGVIPANSTLIFEVELLEVK